MLKPRFWISSLIGTCQSQLRKYMKCCSFVCIADIATHSTPTFKCSECLLWVLTMNVEVEKYAKTIYFIVSCGSGKLSFVLFVILHWGWHLYSCQNVSFIEVNSLAGVIQVVSSMSLIAICSALKAGVLYLKSTEWRHKVDNSRSRSWSDNISSYIYSTCQCILTLVKFTYIYRWTASWESQYSITHGAACWSHILSCQFTSKTLNGQLKKGPNKWSAENNSTTQVVIRTG